MTDPIVRSVENLDRAASGQISVWIAEPRHPIESVAIDCASRIHLCRAACCRLRFALTADEIEHGILRWDPRSPFLILQGEGGHCVHIDKGSLACQVYEHRPWPCRNFDCRRDDRIWISFEEGVPNPALTRKEE